MKLEALNRCLLLWSPKEKWSYDNPLNIPGTRRVDGQRYVIPGTNVHFLGYEVVNLPPFSTLSQIEEYLHRIAKKAKVFGFEPEAISTLQEPIRNGQYCLIPGTKNNYLAQLDLCRKKATIIHTFDSKGNPTTVKEHDYWHIMVGDTGEVNSAYGKWGEPPNTDRKRRKFMDKVRVEKILPTIKIAP